MGEKNVTVKMEKMMNGVLKNKMASESRPFAITALQINHKQHNATPQGTQSENLVVNLIALPVISIQNRNS